MPVEALSHNGKLNGIRFQQTKMENGKVVPIDGNYHDVVTPLVISSIGSIPEMIEGIPSERGVFKISDSNSCLVDGFDHVFAIGNAVTGKGNIVESIKHSREISTEIGENFLDWQHKDYQNWHRQTTVKVDSEIENIIANIEQKDFLSDSAFKTAMGKVRSLQKKVGYNGNYKSWIEKNLPVRLENTV